MRTPSCDPDRSDLQGSDTRLRLLSEPGAPTRRRARPRQREIACDPLWGKSRASTLFSRQVAFRTAAVAISTPRTFRVRPLDHARLCTVFFARLSDAILLA